MTLQHFLSVGVLPAVGVLGLVFTRNRKADEAPARPEMDQPDRDRDRANIRKLHNVALVPANLEGFSIRDLPNGVYGFTYAPATDDAGLFRSRMFQSFEMHKGIDGSVYVLGFVTAETAAQIECMEHVDCYLYPEPAGDAKVLVSVPTPRITRAKGPHRDPSNAIQLTVAGGTSAHP